MNLNLWFEKLDVLIVGVGMVGLVLVVVLVDFEVLVLLIDL